MDRKKILLADDMELFLELEKTFFRREVFDLLVARTGRQAYEMVLAERPDLVFMDLYMPDINGDEACRLIKVNPATAATPVVMVTQAGREGDMTRCREAGCDDILLKPINRHHFMSAARKYLQVAERVTPRIKGRLPVHYGSDSQNFQGHYTVNLSLGGVFIETHDVLGPGTPLALEFTLPHPARTVRCNGRVAWVNDPEKPAKPQFPPGMGVQFAAVDLDSLDAIREFIKKECLSPS